MKNSRRFVSSLITIALLVATGATFAEDALKKKPKQKSAITVGKDTTYVIEPVDARGYVDYLAALNKHASRGVTTKNNAAVLLWQAYGPKSLAAYEIETVHRFYKMLDVPVPTVDRGHFLELEEFLKNNTPADAFDVTVDAAMDARDLAMVSPWTAKQYPLLDDWIRKNDRTLDLAKQASQRTRHYSPWVSDGEESSVLAALFIGMMEQRELARMLATRAMLRTAAGKTDAAWSDLLTCWRLARLYSQGPTLVDGLVAMAVEASAARATAQFVHHAKLTEAQFAALRADLKKLPPRGTMADKLDTGERFFFLDGIQMVEREGPHALAHLTDGVGESPTGTSKTIKRLLMRAAVDWNYVMRDGNARYDRLVAAARLPRGEKRDKAFDAFDREIEKIKKIAVDPNAIIADLLSGKTPRRLASERIAGIFAAIVLPSIQGVVGAEDRADMMVEMTNTAFALRQYRSDHGKYPEKLAPLVPKYIKAVPDDVHTDKAKVRYKKTRTGYVLYGIGRNSKDDGGPDVSIESESDDLGFRVPATK